jgi:hypothetical protein
MLKDYLIIAAFIAANLVWWRLVDARLSKLRLAAIWRWLLAVFMCGQLAYTGWLLLAGPMWPLPEIKPVELPMAGYLWDVLFLPFGLMLLGMGWVVSKLGTRRSPVGTTDSTGAPLQSESPATKSPARDLGLAATRSGTPRRGARILLVEQMRAPLRGVPLRVAANRWVPLLKMLPLVRSNSLSLTQPALGEPPIPLASSGVTRRQVLTATAAAIPPLATLAATGCAVEQMGQFRVSKVQLQVPQLPADLDGLTIAHITDLHLGRFMPVSMTGPISDAINAMQCDLVAFTGDLIDASAPNVWIGVDFIRRLDPRHGLVMIEGNHDVMGNALRFEHEVKDAGLPLLLDETKSFHVPGRATPVQFLGITWGELKSGVELKKVGRERNTFHREYGNAPRDASVRRVAAQRDPASFPILLAHHPHAFDAAAKAGLPLVLSGHTHGGQLMLTKYIGAGPLRFRYWSGLYKKPNSQLFISNGIGSWFPLRVNAPAEIVHLTLRST